MKTTREGAPSDFYLEDRDGEADLDLSAADALDRVATVIQLQGQLSINNGLRVSCV
jgi:hypothetical protein